jgi:endogenous inhibitor of DNA gyrase (YacG/DUF329 family)
MNGDRPRDWPEYPFCSTRCRLIDLGRWLGEKYRIHPQAEGDAPATPEESEIP